MDNFYKMVCEVSKRVGVATTQCKMQIAAVVSIVAGINQGKIGTIVGKTEEGHYRIQFPLLSKTKDGEGVSVEIFGLWWLESAARGSST